METWSIRLSDIMSGVGALLLLVLAEGVRMRWWRGLPCFDTLDFASVVDAALFRGVAVAGAWVCRGVVGAGRVGGLLSKWKRVEKVGLQDSYC